MIYGLTVAVIVLSAALGGVIYDNIRKEMLIEQMICGRQIVPDQKIRTGIISPYRKRRTGGE